MTEIASGAVLFWVIAVASALLISIAALRMIFGPEAGQAKRAAARMTALSGSDERGKIAALVKTKSGGNAAPNWLGIGDLEMLFRRAEITMAPMVFIALLGLGAIVVFAIGAAFFGPLLAFPLAFGLGVLPPIAVLQSRNRKFIDKFVLQLPDALDLMMRGLRVGHPVSVTIANVGRTMADPIGAEFRALAEQISHGEYLTDAFNTMADKIGQEDVDYLAVSISIQHGTGGNLADMLGTLSKVVRDRIMMRRRIKAISSEGRMSALVLSALPVLIYLATTVTAPTYYSSVSDDPLFLPMTSAIVVLVIANYFALRKLVNFNL
jgi:tight adherence protein B